MGMYDEIYDIPVKCPRCGDADPKSAQIKCGPQILAKYIFGKDEIDVDWDFSYYGSIIDKDKHIIGGIATCNSCMEESNRKMEYLIADAKNKGEIERPEGAEYLFECKIGEKNAFTVILNRLDDVYGGNKNISSFHVSIQLKNNIATSANVLD